MQRNKLLAIMIFIPVLFSFFTGCTSENNDYNLRTAIMYNNGDGNIDLAKQLIDNGENINKLPYAPLMEENHSLTFAYKDSHSRPDMVYYLISEGADVNYCSTVSKSPLITLSAYNADYELTSYLIEKGADVNLYGNGNPALTYSVSIPMADEYFQIEVFNLLLENGAEFSDETMQEAIKSGTNDGKMLLLQTVAKTAKNIGYSTGLPFITECAVFGNSEGVLNNFSEFEKLTEDERKLCIYACAAFCNPDVMQKLSESDVDFTQEYFFDGGYIYLIACAYGNTDSLKYIYENNLYPDNAFTEDVNTSKISYFYPDALKYLTDSGSERLFDLFMQYDIDFESKIYNGMTAYEFAENYGSQKRADAIKNKTPEKK